VTVQFSVSVREKNSGKQAGGHAGKLERGKIRGQEKYSYQVSGKRQQKQRSVQCQNGDQCVSVLLTVF